MIAKDMIGSTFNNVKEAVKTAIPDAGELKEKVQQAGDRLGDTFDDVKSRATGTMEALDEMMHKLDDELTEAIDRYNSTYTTFNDNGMRLYIERVRALDLILITENLVNSIANHPKAFDKDLGETEIHRQNFLTVCDFAQEELKAAKKSVATTGAGIAAGAGAAALAPTAAIWVATTFGTASTGAAISTLSGAAASNAALAWLGGGALASGGGGMTGGSALLALAGPVGWGIAGATLLTAIVLFASQKSKINNKKNEEIESVKRNTEALQETDAKLQSILYQTLSLRDELSKQYMDCLPAYGKNYPDIPEDLQTRLGALVNNTKAISKMLEYSL